MGSLNIKESYLTSIVIVIRNYDKYLNKVRLWVVYTLKNWIVGRNIVCVIDMVIIGDY